MDRSESPPPRVFKPVPSACGWKVGLDLGHATTVYQEVYRLPGAPIRPDSSLLPTLISYPIDSKGKLVRDRNLIVIGEMALRFRDRFETFSPLAIAPPRRAVVLLDFIRALRQEITRNHPGSPWGVLACPSFADMSQIRELRTIAGELFERFLLVEEPLLLAAGGLGGPDRSALIVDIGAWAVRASPVGGRFPGPEPRVVVPGGGNAVDAKLQRLLLQKHPDLSFTDLTVSRMKEQLGFIHPARRIAKLKLMLGPGYRYVDVTEILNDACEILVPMVLHAIRDALDRCPSSRMDEFLENILLVGGGAALAGLPERIQDELERSGHCNASVHIVQEPQRLLALGALKWALLTPDEAWEAPHRAIRSAG